MPAMFTVAAFYRFTPFDDPEGIVAELTREAEAAGTCGSVLVASEGINGTVAGSASGVEALLTAIRGLPGCADLTCKESRASEPPFNRMKVRLKREIVTMGQPQPPHSRCGCR